MLLLTMLFASERKSVALRYFVVMEKRPERGTDPPQPGAGASMSLEKRYLALVAFYIRAVAYIWLFVCLYNMGEFAFSIKPLT